MAGIRGFDTSFLDDIKLSEPLTKCIRFNEEELYMVKMAVYKGLSFSAYVKSLITKDVKLEINPNRTSLDTSKEDIRQIVREVLQESSHTPVELNKTNVKEDIENKVTNEAINSLMSLGIKRR